jgi:hypothetical protein
LDLQLPVQSVPITTKVVSSKTVHGEVYLIQHYVIKFVSDLQQIGGLLRFSPPIKLTASSNGKAAINSASLVLTPEKDEF